MDANYFIKQWPEVENLEPDCLAVEEYRQDLRLMVARSYGWLASELFNLEGELGWGPGNREWDEDYLPPPTENSNAYMKTFLNTLLTVKKDEELMEIIRDAISGNCKDNIRLYVHKCLSSKESARSGIINHFYECLTRRGDTYTIGAGRIYLATWTGQKEFLVSLAGLVRLLFKPLKRYIVKAETVKRRFKRFTPNVNNILESVPTGSIIPQVAQSW